MTNAFEPNALDTAMSPLPSVLRHHTMLNCIRQSHQRGMALRPTHAQLTSSQSRHKTVPTSIIEQNVRTNTRPPYLSAQPILSQYSQVRMCRPSVFGCKLQCELVRHVATREECHWSHAWPRFKRSKGVGTNGTPRV
jgi:hypothetical protein